MFWSFDIRVLILFRISNFIALKILLFGYVIFHIPELSDDDCYFQLAIITSNTTLCDFFQEGGNRHICLGAATKDRNYCEEIESSFEKRLCFSHVPKKLEECEIGGQFKDAKYRLKRMPG